MTLAQLRKELPDYEWRAIHAGFGWQYRGTPTADPEDTVTVFGILVPVSSTVNVFESGWHVQTFHSLRAIEYNDFVLQVTI